MIVNLLFLDLHPRQSTGIEYRTGRPIALAMSVPSSPKRFTGGTPSGRRYVGFATAHHPGTKASIPSRFETILNDNHEANGFGCRTYRFGVSENDLPGPGTYARIKEGVSTRKATSNYSAHGTASFASAKKAGFADDTPTNSSPGPGSYNTFVKSSQDFHAGGSVSFSMPVGRRPQVSHRYVSPGPGQYNISSSDRRIACSAFASRAPKELALPTSITTYLTEAHTSTFGKDTRRSASMASQTARFTSRRIGSTGSSGQRELPPLMSVITGYSVRNPAPDVLSQTAECGGSPSRVGRVRERVLKPSPMFTETLLDRFGNPTVRYAIAQPNDIGPGHYEQEARTKKMLVSSAWALNAVPRDGARERYQPPGPAYYTSEYPSRKVSHRSNSTNTWSF